MSNPSDIPVVILCGGMGTRLKEETGIIPKPMVTIGGRPLLWHLMKFYSAAGFRRFVLCLGYKGEVIKHYFLNYFELTSSFTIEVGANGPAHVVHGSSAEPWSVSCVDTGEQAMTGARIKRVQPYVGASRFMLTYGDGLSDIDLAKLLEFHSSHGKLVTITGVHPPSRFGLLTLDGDRVAHFAEKPQTAHDYINGGFFVCEPGFFDLLEDDDKCTLERKPLERAAEQGELHAFLHDGYWQCMDTMRDRELLEEAWQHGGPWKKW
jgi:glucose-1-phosphate cytidylyltransferase